MPHNTTPNTSSIVSKALAFCQTLRDDGVGYGDYLEHLTYLLFLKMVDEYSKPPYIRKMPIPAAFNWESLTNKSGDELEVHYSKLSATVGPMLTIIKVHPITHTPRLGL